jgi:hypothetical protein
MLLRRAAPMGRALCRLLDANFGEHFVHSRR